MKGLFILLLLALFVGISLLLNFLTTYLGNLWLVDVGLDEASYWSWYGFTLVMGIMTARGSSK